MVKTQSSQRRKRMKHIALKLAALITITALATPVFAQSTLEDTDGNGAFSFAELSIGYPTLTDDIFIGMDTDESGEISVDELSAGLEAGLLQL
jgi:hypothetical protein